MKLEQSYHKTTFKFELVRIDTGNITDFALPYAN